jgi:hypothetical protein
VAAPTPQSVPRNAAGNTEPHDHAEIHDSDFVIRYTTPQDLHTETNGVRRISSGTFSESSDGGMSVIHERWVAEDNIDPMQYAKEKTHGAVRINVGQLRAQGFKVGYDPLPENPHHCAVWGIGNGSPRKRRIQKLAITIHKCGGET